MCIVALKTRVVSVVCIHVPKAKTCFFPGAVETNMMTGFLQNEAPQAAGGVGVPLGEKLKTVIFTSLRYNTNY